MSPWPRPIRSTRSPTTPTATRTKKTLRRTPMPDTLPRKFVHGTAVLVDPDPNMTPDAVKAMYAAAGYPDLTSASITGPEVKDGFQVYSFKRSIGTKGLGG